MRDLTSLDAIFNALGLSDNVLINGELEVYSPIDGHVIARIDTDTRETVSNKIEKANKAYHSWRLVPAPKRGELIRLFGMELRGRSRASDSALWSAPEISSSCGTVATKLKTYTRTSSPLPSSAGRLVRTVRLVAA